MRITAFTEGESGEPTTVDHDIECIGADEDATTFGELVQDITNASLEDIDVVSENVATIAIHALHGVLKATEGVWSDPGIVGSGPARAARASALAALLELAFYDVDGIETVDLHEVLGPHGVGDDAEGYMAADPGRGAVDKIRAGTRLTDGIGTPVNPDKTVYYVEWPDDKSRLSGGAEGDA